MVVPKINSSHGSETRNIINAAIDSINMQGKTIQDLVAKGQLTPAQYGQLISIVNGNIARGDVSVYDIDKNKGKFDQTYLTQELIDAITGAPGANILSEVADKSVTRRKIAKKAVSAEETDFLSTSTNILDTSASTHNMRINSETGGLTSDASRSTSDFISVEPGTYLAFKYVDSYGRYDEDRNFISLGSISDAGEGTTKLLNNATYFIRVDYYNSYKDQAQVNRGDVVKEYEPHYVKLSENVGVDYKLKPSEVKNENIAKGAVSANKTSFIRFASNLFNKKEVLNGKVILADGSVKDEKNYIISKFIKIDPETAYTYAKVYHVNYYESDNQGSFIERIDTYPDREEKTLTTPLNANYIRVSTNTSVYNPDEIQINDGESLLPYEEWHPPVLDGVVADTSASNETDFKYYDQFVYAGDLSSYYDQSPLNGRQGPMSWDAVHTMFDDYVNNHSDYVTRKVEGTSVEGREIYSLDLNPDIVEDQSEKTKFPTVVIIGSIHGIERVPPEVIRNFVDLLCNHWKENEVLETLRWNVRFKIIPLLNPDGWQNDSRKNANGVDLNRNFSGDWIYISDQTSSTYSGEAPFSEPESLIAKNFIENTEDLIYIADFHNFSSGPDPDYFFWVVGGSKSDVTMGKSFSSLMSRKLKRTYSFLPQADSQMLSWASTVPGGMVANYASSLNVNGATFETGMSINNDPLNEGYSENVMTIATEGFVNWMALTVRESIKIINGQ